jgi:hypothetical protein
MTAVRYSEGTGLSSSAAAAARMPHTGSGIQLRTVMLALRAAVMMTRTDQVQCEAATAAVLVDQQQQQQGMLP